MNYKENFLKLFSFFTKSKLDAENKNGRYVMYDRKEKIEEWFKNGQLHREDGPAIKTSSVDSWYKNGQKHRIGGPAIYPSSIHNYGINHTTEWWENGELHRLDGPAITDMAGYGEWRLHGKKHRTDGPAVYKDDGDQYHLEWWINGQELSYEAFQKFLLHEELQKDVENKNINHTKKLKI